MNFIEKRLKVLEANEGKIMKSNGFERVKRRVKIIPCGRVDTCRYEGRFYCTRKVIQNLGEEPGSGWYIFYDNIQLESWEFED